MRKVFRTCAAAFLCAVGCLLHTAAFAAYPQPADDYVNDFAKIIPEDSVKRLQEVLDRLEYQTGIEMTVVTVGSIYDYQTGDATIESFATNLFNAWGIGHRRANNGVLFLVAVNDRKARIELGGAYGRAYDSAMQSIMDGRIVPAFRDGAYALGIEVGTEAIIAAVTRKVSFWEVYWLQITLGGLALLFAAAGVSCLLAGKKGWGWTLLMIAGALFAAFIYVLFTGRRSGGFGGGSSGGGGATGSW